MNDNSDKSTTKGRATLTDNIKDLIKALEIHHRKHNSNEKFLVMSTFILAISTTLLFIITFCLWKTDEETSKRDAEAADRNEKMRQTIALCENFYNWYGNYENIEKDLLLQKLKHWANHDTLWKKLNDKEARLIWDTLNKKRVVNRLFHYFENAKMLDQDTLLEREYFANFFSIWFQGLKCTKRPNVNDWLDSLRNIHGPTVFDGYDYCLDTILYSYPDFVKEYKKTCN